MRISDWSSDVCSSDLIEMRDLRRAGALEQRGEIDRPGADRGHRLIFLHVLDVEGIKTRRQAIDQLSGVRPGMDGPEIGRASCRESVCQYVSISVGAVSLKKKQKT